MTPRRIVVVGGGISGLAAAFYLSQARQAGAPLEEYLVEASSRLGGALRSERVDGCLVEAGADSFLTEKPEAMELCRQLGLGGQLLGSNDRQRRTLILHRGRLVPLPEGLEFLVPTRPWAVARTPLLSLADKLALATEVFHRPRRNQPDESVADFLGRHFSRGLVESIADPLLSAVYGGDSASLSAAAVLPRFVQLEKKHGSLIRGMRAVARERRTKAATPRLSLFTTLRDGLGSLVEALRQRLEKDRVLCGRRVLALESTADGYRVQLDGKDSLPAASALLALPAPEAARLLRPLDTVVAEGLTAIPYSSSLIMALGYDARAVSSLPGGFGFLVPRKETYRLRACTFVGQKFPGRVPSNRVLLRCFLGGVRDEAVLELNDAAATGLVQEELRAILGISAEPLFARVYRWRKALAQYTVGHHQRLEAIQGRLAKRRGLFLCGNAYQGIGISDCVRSAKAAVDACLRELAG